MLLRLLMCGMCLICCARRACSCDTPMPCGVRLTVLLFQACRLYVSLLDRVLKQPELAGALQACVGPVVARLVPGLGDRNPRVVAAIREALHMTALAAQGRALPMVAFVCTSCFCFARCLFAVCATVQQRSVLQFVRV